MKSMKAIRVIDGAPQYIDAPLPKGRDSVTVKIVSASICGSDLHLMGLGFAEGRILGHEFAGLTPDGTAVAVEPLGSCGECWACDDGYRSHCTQGPQFYGVGMDGGMAEYVEVSADALVPIKSGVDIRNASLVEPLAVAVHGVQRARINTKDKVLIVGAGPIGLAAAAVLRGRGIATAIAARHPHQQAAAEQLGATLIDSDRLAGDYDVVLDAVGATGSIETALQAIRPMGRIGMLGSFWEPVELSVAICMKEAELIPASTYKCKAPNRSFDEAALLLHDNPSIAEHLISHRFPLEAAAEAFTTAADRAAGAIKVVFDVGSPS